MPVDASLDDKTALQISMIRTQFSKLDPDLAKHVVFASLSLNPTTVYRSVQLMMHLQMLRLMEEDKTVTKAQKEEFELSTQLVMPQTYLDLKDKPQ